MFRSRVLAVLILSIEAAACGGDQNAQGPGGAGGRGAFPPMEVKTIVLEAKPIPQSSEFVATVRSLRSSTVQPQVEGIVRQVMVRAGDRVRVGQPMIQIDPDKQQATNTVTESQRASREADLAYAKQQLARMRSQTRGREPRELEQSETSPKRRGAAAPAFADSR